MIDPTDYGFRLDASSEDCDRCHVVFSDYKDDSQPGEWCYCGPCARKLAHRRKAVKLAADRAEIARQATAHDPFRAMRERRAGP